MDIVTFLSCFVMNNAELGSDRADLDVYFSSKGYETPGHSVVQLH